MNKYLIIYIIFVTIFTTCYSQSDELLLYGLVYPICPNNSISGDNTCSFIFKEHVITNIFVGGGFILSSLTIMIWIPYGFWAIGYVFIATTIVGLITTRSFNFFLFFPITIGMLLAFTLYLMVKPFRKKDVIINDKEKHIKIKQDCGC